jgi:hypothetical protein
MKRVLGLLAGAFALALLPSLALRAADPADPVVAQRGAVTITASQVRLLLQMADPEVRAQLQRDPKLLAQRVRERLVQLVLLDQARAEKWDERPEVAFRAELAREGAIVESYVAAQVPPDPAFPSEQQIAAAYEANKARMVLPKQYHLAQILISVPAGASAAADAEAKKRAADLRHQIVDQRADFAVLAKKESGDKGSATSGGELGWVREDALVPAIRQVLAGLTAGSVSEPVRTPDGWHVLKVIAIKPSGTATLAEAHDTLVRALRQERAVQGQRRYIAEMLQREPITLDEVELWKQTAQ